MEKIFEIKDGVLIKCLNKDIVEAVIPDGVNSIGREAFRDCLSLKAVYISDGVTCIEAWAFNDCSSLKNNSHPR